MARYLGRNGVVSLAGAVPAGSVSWVGSMVRSTGRKFGMGLAGFDPADSRCWRIWQDPDLAVATRRWPSHG